MRASQRALIERQEVVIPIAVRVSPQKGRATDRADNADVGTVAVVRVEDVEGVGLRVDARDHLLPGPFPVCFGIPKVRDVLMRALRMRLGDASHLNVSHCDTFQVGGTESVL